MKAVLLYRPNTDYAREALQYVKDYSSQTGRTIDLLSLDTEEGADFARLYDVVRYPAIVVKREDGQLQGLWQGLPLPLMSEIESAQKG